MKKQVLSLFGAALFAFAITSPLLAQSDQDLLGKVAPGFNLKNINGNMISLDSYLPSAKGVILVFTCNHCPYSVKYEDRIIALDNKYRAEDFVLLAINPNDPVAYEADNFKNMQKRAKKKGFGFPYLVDETQAIAKAYGATRTPHVYLLANEGGQFIVRYVGAIDDNTEENAVTVNYVDEAIAKVNTGGTPEPAYTKAVGCGIKWTK